MAGFECPTCGCNASLCQRSYPDSEKTLRTRRCLKCGFVFQTSEVIVPESRLGLPPPKVKTQRKKKSGGTNGTPVEGALSKALKSAK